VVHRHCRRDGAIPEGSYVEPCLIEIPDLSVLAGEVFGPVLHFITYPRDHLPALMEQVAATDYALTFGVHSRIDETIETLVAASHAGNVYVNRNMVGAVVGVQPFGGEWLSGTGPKAGGPLYLLRLVKGLPPTAAWNALRASAALGLPVMSPGLLALYDHLLAEGELEVARNCMDFVRYSATGLRAHLPGPTGEDNLYLTYPRGRVLCLGGSRLSRLRQLAAVLALGGKAVWGQEDQRLHSSLPEAVQGGVEVGTTAGQALLAAAPFDAVLLCGSAAQARDCALALAQRPGPIVPLVPMSDAGDLALERLLGERSISVNTTAAGGNASLMSLA
jgi:RHH-type proline utilization regulon transcriptional repressor/proline dehydrogenase/delta 1-pyrroline-5-carboxylate dehydrogenase